MYIWKTESLATDIKNNNVGAGELKNYYLTLSIFMTITMYITAISPRENMLMVLVELIALIGILIFGVSITYQSNKGDEGVDYISRMTILSLPITVKVFSVSLFVGIVCGILGEALKLPDDVIEWLMVGFVILIQIVFFWRLNCHIRYINT